MINSYRNFIAEEDVQCWRANLARRRALLQLHPKHQSGWIQRSKDKKLCKPAGGCMLSLAVQPHGTPLQTPDKKQTKEPTRQGRIHTSSTQTKQQNVMACLKWCILLEVTASCKRHSVKHPPEASIEPVATPSYDTVRCWYAIFFQPSAC